MWPFRRKRPGVFYYKIGDVKKSMDGLQAATKLDAHPKFKWEQVDTLLEPVNVEDEALQKLSDQEQHEAQDAVLEGFRDVFELPDYRDGKGFSDAEVLGLVSDFTIWLSGLKKNIESPLTSSPSTDHQERSTMNSDSDSGSIQAEHSFVKQAS